MKPISALILALLVALPAASSQATEISITELPVKDYKVGFGDLWIGKNVNDRKVVLKGKEIEDYLFAHAPSRIVYDIPQGVTSFSAWGVKTQGDDKVVAGTWLYIVKIDGKEVFRSKSILSYDFFEVPVNVSIPAGSKTIELIIDDLRNNFCDHSIWAKPVFK